MQLKSTVFVLSFFAAGIVLFGGSAKADSFTFSFTNTTGDVSGTVTGEILGLTNNSTSSATDVIIESFPSALGSDLFTSYTAPIDVFASPWYTTSPNTFTETNGQITAANFGMDDGDWTYLILGSGCNDISQCGNAMGNWETGDFTGDIGGNSTVTFAALSTSSTPEPSTLGLALGGGLGGLYFIRRRRKA
jgi:hypothetical protein